MNKRNRANSLAASLIILTVLNTAEADNIRILAADFHHSGSDHWSVEATLQHGDTGWDHFPHPGADCHAAGTVRSGDIGVNYANRFAIGRPESILFLMAYENLTDLAYPFGR